MTLRWPSVAPAPLLAAAACVSFDPAGPPARDISGTYGAVVVMRITNEFEVRSDSFTATLDLRGDLPDNHRLFTGTYRIAPSETGPFDGELRTDSTLLLTDFGTPPKPVAGVAAIRARYPWCDLMLLGLGPILGTFRSDVLDMSGRGSMPCFYRLSGGLVRTVNTDIFLSVTASR